MYRESWKPREMLRLQCPVQNYAWGRKPDGGGGKRGSEVIIKSKCEHVNRFSFAPRLYDAILPRKGGSGLVCMRGKIPLHLGVPY